MDVINFKYLQAEVFSKLRNDYKEGDLVSELGILLDLQKAAVYKRMSGETLVKFDELVKISRHFNFSLDDILNTKSKNVSFQYDLLDREIDTYQDVLEYVRDVFDSFRNLPDNKLIYASRHLPFMYYLRYPDIFEIHMHVWKNSSFFNENGRYKESQIKRLSPTEIEVMKYMHQEYEKHPMIEIWGTSILQDLYSKIRFLVLSNVIKDASYLDSLLTSIKLLINSLKTITLSAHKNTESGSQAVTHKIYLNELDLGTPMLYYSSMQESKVFLIHQEPNFICTYDSRFCEYSRDLLQNIIDHSIVISGEGTRQRIKYFNEVDDSYTRFCVSIQKAFEFANS